MPGAAAYTAAAYTAADAATDETGRVSWQGAAPDNTAAQRPAKLRPGACR